MGQRGESQLLMAVGIIRIGNVDAEAPACKKRVHGGAGCWGLGSCRGMSAGPGPL